MRANLGKTSLVPLTLRGKHPKNQRFFGSTLYHKSQAPASSVFLCYVCASPTQTSDFSSAFSSIFSGSLYLSFKATVCSLFYLSIPNQFPFMFIVAIQKVLVTKRNCHVHWENLQIDGPGRGIYRERVGVAQNKIHPWQQRQSSPTHFQWRTAWPCWWPPCNSLPWAFFADFIFMLF